MLKKIILWAAVIFLSCRIFSFSAEPASKSAGTSEKITKVVVSVVKKATPASAQEGTWEQDLFAVCHKIVRKTAHFSLYAALAVLTLLLARSYRLKMALSGAISVAYCLIFSISDEIHQTFVDGRSGQISDVCLDFLGTLFGIGVFLLVWRLVRRKRKRI